MRRAKYVGLLIAVLTLTGAACDKTAPIAGRAAPTFRADDVHGLTHYLEAARGQVLVLTFFATWCAPCREEIPLLVELTETTRDRARVWCVAIDPENADRLRQLADGMKLPYPVLLDENHRIATAYGVRELPRTFVIDGQGTIRSVFETLTPARLAQLQAEIDRLADEP